MGSAASGPMTLIRITEGGRVRPGDYIVESTPAELEDLSPEEAVMFDGGVIWWRYLEEEEGVHCYERPPFMPEALRAKRNSPPGYS